MPSLYLDQFTTIDCAIAGQSFSTNRLSIAGMSYMVSIELQGELNGDEAVIVDFGTLKKKIKHWIDGDDGFDHKLLISESDLDKFTSYPKDTVFDQAVGIYPNTGSINGLPIVPAAYVPKGVIKRINCRTGLSNHKDAYSTCAILESEVKSFLQDKIDNEYPDQHIKVSELILSTSITSEHKNPDTSLTIMFQYTHGLKNSTSYGCQNAFHGHLSYIRLQLREGLSLKDPKVSELIYELRDSMLGLLDGVRFVMEDNILSSENQSGSIVEYYTCSRGVFDVNLTQLGCKYIVLPTETTIENLAGWIVSVFKDRLVTAGVAKVYVSEGLTKGSMINV